MTAPAIPLENGETEVRRWTISGHSFAIRCGAMFLGTLMLLSPIAVSHQVSYLIMSPVLALCLMWALGDFTMWRVHRDTIWLLSNQAVHIHGPDGDTDQVLRLPLGSITAVRRFTPWSLVLRLDNGLAVTLPLAPDPRALQAQILAAQNADAAAQASA